jgi:uracil-DNA glycosylase
MESQTNLFSKSSPKEFIELSINWPKTGSEFRDLKELFETAKSCLKCGLCETRTNVVVQDGNPQAQLMLIGEGPGEQEDLSGLPFVGRAGQLLDKILEAADIDRKTETYISNIVKCRPPNNRVPLPSEADACWVYLKSQIELIKPKVILLLGATAISGILKVKNPKITKLHGRWIEGQGELLQGILLMPFYHPSYLLRNSTKEVGGPKWQAWQAIKEVKKKLLEICTDLASTDPELNSK